MGMEQVQLMLGVFPFRIGVNSYNSLKEIYTYRWSESETIGGSVVHGGLARKPKISLEGMANTVRSGKWSLVPLKLQADMAKPLTMVDFYGLYHGLWVVEKIEFKNRDIVLQGLPRAIEFTLELKRFD